MSQKTGPDGKLRCGWSLSAPEFLHYHDREWGFPVADDRRLFEKLCLEGFQSGLSWRTILAKRENFRVAFHQFDFDRITRFTERDVERLVKDEGIIRHRGKIESVIDRDTHVNVCESFPVESFQSPASTGNVRMTSSNIAALRRRSKWWRA